MENSDHHICHQTKSMRKKILLLKILFPLMSSSTYFPTCTSRGYEETEIENNKNKTCRESSKTQILYQTSKFEPSPSTREAAMSSDIPDGWEERTSRSSGKPGRSGYPAAMYCARETGLWTACLKVHSFTNVKLFCLSCRYEILREPVHEAVAMGGSHEACGEGVEREGSGEAPPSQARRVAETEFVEARGYYAHKGKPGNRIEM